MTNSDPETLQPTNDPAESLYQDSQKLMTLRICSRIYTVKSIN
jgi:hypothetical protein